MRATDLETLHKALEPPQMIIIMFHLTTKYSLCSVSRGWEICWAYLIIIKIIILFYETSTTSDLALSAIILPKRYYTCPYNSPYWQRAVHTSPVCHPYWTCLAFGTSDSWSVSPPAHESLSESETWNTPYRGSVYNQAWWSSTYEEIESSYYECCWNLNN